MAIVTQFSVRLENRPGSLADACSQLAAKAVNIQAIALPVSEGEGVARFVVNHPDTARKVFQELHVEFSEEQVLAVHLSDRPGALGRVTRKLAEHSVNIEYAYGSIEKGAPKALIILGVSHPEKAAGLVK